MLTSTQLTSLRIALFGNTTSAALIATAQSTKADADLYAVTDWANSPSGSVAWNSATPVFSVIDSIDFTKYTPVSALDDGTLSDATIAARRQAQLLGIQTKQMNLQMMLQGRDKIDATKATLRNGLRDAVIQVPAGASGAAASPGGASGVTTLTACTRSATRAEVMLSSGTATTGTVSAYVLPFEGSVTNDEMARMLWHPDGSPWLSSEL